MKMDFKNDIEVLAKHYGALVKQYGDGAESAQYADRATQERRMEVLCEIGLTPTSKVLDFGCGTGQMLAYLQRTIDFRGEYVGYDVSPEAIAFARSAHPAGRFEVRDVLEDAPQEDFDFILVSGVFNNAMSDNRAFFRAASRCLMARARGGYAFNMLSRFVDYFDEGLYYEDPMEAFRFCKVSRDEIRAVRLWRENSGKCSRGDAGWGV